MRDQPEIRIVRVRAHREAQAAHEPQHAFVVGEHQADDFLQALFARHVHDAEHQARAQALAGEGVVHHQRELAAGLVGVGDVARHADDALAHVLGAVGVHRFFLDHGAQRHLAVVVDQGETRQHRRRQLGHAGDEAEVARFGRQPFHEGLQRLRVVRVDGSHRVFAAALERPQLLVARRIGQDGQVAVAPRAAGRGLRRRSDDDARVHRHRAVLVHDDGVDVHLAQLGQLAHHLGHAQQHLFQRRHVDRRRTAPGAQRLVHARALHQPARQELVERRHFHGVVVHQLDHGAAGAEGDHRAERVVGDHADVELAPARLARHGLHGDAVDAGVGHALVHGVHHLVPDVAHGGGVHHVQRHAAHVALVADVGRVDLQRHRKAELGGDHHGLGGGARQQRLRDGDVEGRQQRLRFHLGQHLAALGQHALDQQARAFHVGRRQFVRQRRRRLLQQLLVLVEAGDVAEGAHRRLGRAEARDQRVGQRVTRRLHRGVAHPAGHQRLAHARLGLHQHVGHGVGVAAELGRIDHQHAVDAAVLAGNLQRGAVVLGAGVLGQVDQVRQRGVLRQQRLQLARAIFGQQAQVEPQLAHPVGRQHAGAAAVGDDGQAPAHRPVARGQALGGREQLHKGAHAHRAGAAQHGVEHLVAADDSAGMRLRRGVAGQLAAGLEHHHRLGVGRRPQRAGEAPRVGDAFHVDHDAVRVAVGRQVVQHRRQRDLRVRPQRHHGGEAHLVLLGPVHDRRGERARLRHQRQLAGRGQIAHRAGVELQLRPLEALAVGPQQPEALALRHAVHLGRLLCADAGGKHQRRLHADAAGEFQRGHDLARRQGDHGQVGLDLRQIGQGAGGAGVERGDVALEGLRLQVRQQRQRLRRLLVGLVLRAGEQDDGLGLEERGQVMLVHGVLGRFS